jgi:hypothetical protein
MIIGQVLTSPGILLTMSPDLGVDYLDKDLGDYLKYPRDRRLESEEASVLGFLWKRFRKSGTHTWHRPTVEWFLVYLLTELAASPHTIRQGRNTISLISAYQQVVQDLVCNIVVLHYSSNCGRNFADTMNLRDTNLSVSLDST